MSFLHHLWFWHAWISVFLCIAVSISKPPSSGRPWFGLGRDIPKSTLPTARYEQRASHHSTESGAMNQYATWRTRTRRTQASCHCHCGCRCRRHRVGAAKRDDADSFISSSCPTMHISGRPARMDIQGPGVVQHLGQGRTAEGPELISYVGFTRACPAVSCDSRSELVFKSQMPEPALLF